MTDAAAGGFQPPHHNHRRCTQEALDRAADLCRSEGLRLTEQRRRVLELVWSSHKPIGAYALMEALAEDGRPVAPPTVYRALQFLLDHGLIHRIERLNAFVGCPDADTAHSPQFLICNDCGDVAEMRDPAVASAIAAGARAAGFATRMASVEVTGLCPACAEGAARP